MNIKEIKINNYGNIQNKEIRFTEGINVIHGANESGKSTLLSYIVNNFYGISKNKDGKNITDYEKYKPWIGEEFSGKINYELDDGKKYEVFRDFNKKNPKVYNEELEDISNNYDIDKKDGNQFFTEQTNVDKQMYLSTVVSMQQELKLDDKTQNVLVQKIANLAGTGDDSISYKKAMSKLQDKLKDEIGTSRTAQKPINIVQNELEKIENKIKEIEPYENQKYTIDNQKEKILGNISKIKQKKDLVTNFKNSIEEENFLKSKIEINIEKQQYNKKKLEELTKEKETLEQENKKSEKKIDENIVKKRNTKIYIIFFIIFFILTAISMILIKNTILSVVFGIITIVLMLFNYVKEVDIKKERENNKKENDNIKKNNDNRIVMIQGQILLLEKENEKTEKEIAELNKKMNEDLENKKVQINKKYENEINENELKNLLVIGNLNQTIEKVENELRENTIELNKLEIEEKTVLPQLDNLVVLREKQCEYKEKYDELKNYEEIINIAVDNLQEAYEEMKNTITPKFTQNLSKNMSKISNNKYSKVTINDEKGLIIENDNGEYISVDQLSVGTIDQLYLSLRLSMIEELSNERLPIMLDETFAYFDDERLENILKYLVGELNKHQVLIFTCTDREHQILKKMKVEFNNIEL